MPTRQRVQRLMRAATGPEPVRKAFEVDLIDLVEDRHHGLLNDFVLQRRDAQRTLPPVSLRNIDSPRGLCPIRSTVHPAVQIDEPILQSGFILLPRHAIHSRRSLTLEARRSCPGADPTLRWWSKAVNRSCFLSLAACRTPSNPWDMRFPLCVGCMCD